MTTKNAAIRITLSDASFKQGLRGMERETARTAQTMSQRLSKGVTAGMGGAKGALRDMGRSIKMAVGAAAGIAGVAGIGTMVMDAMRLQKSFRDIAYTTRKIGAGAMSWRQVQDRVNSVVAQTGQKTEDVATAFQSLVSQTGDVGFASDAIQSMGTTATASGKNINELVNAASFMREQFGLSGKEIQSAMAIIESKTGVGGVTMEDFTARIAMLGGAAKEAGMTGATGMAQLVGMMNVLDDRMGGSTISGRAMAAMFEKLRSGGGGEKRLEAKAGIKFETGESPLAKIRKMLGSGRGRTVMKAELQGPAAAAAAQLAAPFTEAYAVAQKAGADEKAATAAGLAAFDAAVKKMSTSTMSYEQIMKEAARRRKEDPAQKMQEALDKLRTAFTKKEMLQAMEKLAKMLPKLVDSFGSILNFVVEHPIASAGIGVGAKLGGGFIGSMIPSLMGFGGGGSTVGKGGAFGGGGPASMMAKTAADFAREAGEGKVQVKKWSMGVLQPMVKETPTAMQKFNSALAGFSIGSAIGGAIGGALAITAESASITVDKLEKVSQERANIQGALGPGASLSEQRQALQIALKGEKALRNEDWTATLGAAISAPFQKLMGDKTFFATRDEQIAEQTKYIDKLVAAMTKNVEALERNTKATDSGGNGGAAVFGSQPARGPRVQPAPSGPGPVAG